MKTYKIVMYDKDNNTHVVEVEAENLGWAGMWASFDYPEWTMAPHQVEPKPENEQSENSLEKQEN